MKNIAPTKQLQGVGIWGLAAIIIMAVVHQLAPGSIDFSAEFMGVPLSSAIVLFVSGVGGWLNGDKATDLLVQQARDKATEDAAESVARAVDPMRQLADQVRIKNASTNAETEASNRIASQTIDLLRESMGKLQDENSALNAELRSARSAPNPSPPRKRR